MGAGVLGPGGIPPCLDIDYAELQVPPRFAPLPPRCAVSDSRPQGAAGRALLAAGAGPTAEHDVLCAFLKAHAAAPLAGLPAAVRIRRAADVSPGAAARCGARMRCMCSCAEPRPNAADVTACFQGAGRPLVVTDALRNWPAKRDWTPEVLLRRYGTDQVRWMRDTTASNAWVR